MNENGKIEEREIKIGINNGEKIEVIEGVNEGEKVVVDKLEARSRWRRNRSLLRSGRRMMGGRRRR